MQILSRLAEAVLAELAAEQGLRSLVPDTEDIIPIELGDVTLAMAFNAASESAFLISVVADGPTAGADWPWLIFALGSPLAVRRTRLAIEPETGQLALIAQIALTGLAQGEFVAKLEAFLDDVRTIRKGLAVGAFQSRPEAPVDEADFVIMRL